MPASEKKTGWRRLKPKGEYGPGWRLERPDRLDWGFVWLCEEGHYHYSLGSWHADKHTGSLDDALWLAEKALRGSQ